MQVLFLYKHTIILELGFSVLQSHPKGTLGKLKSCTVSETMVPPSEQTRNHQLSMDASVYLDKNSLCEKERFLITLISISEITESFKTWFHIH